MKTYNEIVEETTNALCELMERYGCDELNSYEIRLCEGEIDWWNERNRDGGLVIFDGDTLFDQLSEVNFGDDGGWNRDDVRRWVSAVCSQETLDTLRAASMEPRDCKTRDECVKLAENIVSSRRYDMADEAACDLVRRYLELSKKLEGWQEVKAACDDIDRILLEAGPRVDFLSWAAETTDDGEVIPGDADEVSPGFFTVCVCGMNEAWLANAIGRAFGHEPEDVSFCERDVYTALFKA